jgi:hypothetical protein
MTTFAWVLAVLFAVSAILAYRKYGIVIIYGVIAWMLMLALCFTLWAYRTGQL